jgi:type I restriction enzyme M protein
MEKTAMAKAKKAVEKAINLDNILFNCRDILRAARNSGSFFEKRDMMLTLVFLRFIGEKYEDGVEKLRQILTEQGLDPDDENIRAAFFDEPPLQTERIIYLSKPDGQPSSIRLRLS